MRILFIRHGHPDYAHDCLTSLGRRQAQLAARRLQHEGIGRIFASSHGRAVETAQHTAALLGCRWNSGTLCGRSAGARRTGAHCPSAAIPGTPATI